MSPKLALALTAALVIAACASPERRRAERDAALVDRVCSLPEAERQAELERLKKESGMMIYCARPKDASSSSSSQPDGGS